MKSRRAIHIIALACCGLMAMPTTASAQSKPAASSTEPVTQRKLKEIEDKRQSLSLLQGSESQRLAAIEEVLALRQSLIDSQTDRANRGVWMHDQAADMLFELLPIDASGMTALFGVPSPDQRERAGRVAREVHRLASEAERLISQAIADFEAAGDFENNPTLQQKRRDLIEQERDRRGPFLLGVGAFLEAELNSDDVQRRATLHRQAADLLLPLAETLEGAAALQARLHAGLALARLGEFDAAEALFAHIATDGAARPQDIFTARMGGVFNRTQRGGPSAGLIALDSIEPRYLRDDSDSSSMFFRILIADQRFLLRRQLADAAGPNERRDLLTQAAQVYVDLCRSLAPPPGQSAAQRQSVRSLVLDRLANAITPDMPLEQLPPLARIARAQHLSRQASARAQSIDIVESVLADASLIPAERAEALHTLAMALYEDGQQLPAAQRFLELATDHPDDSRADRAIETAAAIAADWYQHDTLDGEARDTLRQALSLLLERYPNLPSIDQWRYMAGRLALDDGKFDDAAALFAQIAPDAEHWLDSHFMRAVVVKARADATSDSDERRRSYASLLEVVDRTHSILESGLESAGQASRAAAIREYIAWLRVFRAHAMLTLDQPLQAIEAVAGIETNASLDSAVLAEALEARIQAFEALDRPDDVAREIERFTQAVPDKAANAVRPAMARMQLKVQALIDSGAADQALELAHRTLLPAAQILSRWLTDRPLSSNDPLLLAWQVADAFRLSGQYSDALAWYDRLIGQQPDSVQLLGGRAECLFHLGGEQRLAQAMQIYKRVAAGLSNDAANPSAKAAFWLAQLRMLQIIDQVGRNTEQIVPRIERLRLEDPQFGGERFRRGFEALRNKHQAKARS